MKIGVSATGGSMDAQVEPRFGMFAVSPLIGSGRPVIEHRPGFTGRTPVPCYRRSARALRRADTISSCR